MSDAREQFEARLRGLLGTAPRKLIEVESFVQHLADGLLAEDPGDHRYGWLIAYGKVRPVTETEFMDSDGGGGRTWTVWTTGEVEEDDE